MPAPSTEDVLAMYSKYPYPSPTVGLSLSFDIANLFYLICESDELINKKNPRCWMWDWSKGPRVCQALPEGTVPGS